MPKKPDAPTPDEILSFWNRVVTEPLRPARMTPKRRRLLQRRIKDLPDPKVWETAIFKINESEFCKGDNDRGWVASFGISVCERQDFIVRAFEGTYDDKFTTGELERASHQRFHAQGSNDCWHDPSCETKDECNRRWAKTVRNRRR